MFAKRNRQKHRKNREFCNGLCCLNRGKKAVITSTPDNLLLAPMGVRKGKEIQLKAKQPWGGPLIVEIEGRNVAISRDLGKRIKIKGVKNVN